MPQKPLTFKDVRHLITNQLFLLHGQFVWRYLITFCPALILTLPTHTPAVENALTPATQNVLLVNCKVILVNQSNTVTLQGNKVHDLNRAVVHNTDPWPLLNPDHIYPAGILHFFTNATFSPCAKKKKKKKKNPHTKYNSSALLLNVIYQLYYQRN